MTGLELFLTSIGIAVVSMDISKTAIFRPFRQWFFNRWYFAFKLLSCPWCIAHWLALAVVLKEGLFYGWIFVLVGCSAVPMIVIDYLFLQLDKEN